MFVCCPHNPPGPEEGLPPPPSHPFAARTPPKNCSSISRDTPPLLHCSSQCSSTFHLNIPPSIAFPLLSPLLFHCSSHCSSTFHSHVPPSIALSIALPIALPLIFLLFFHLPPPRSTCHCLLIALPIALPPSTSTSAHLHLWYKPRS